MNNLIPTALIVMACSLCYIAYKLQKISKAINGIYKLPHGESAYSIGHHEFNSVGIQYILIAVRAIMHMWMQQSVTSENFEVAENWRQAIIEVEKLIKTKINK